MNISQILINHMHEPLGFDLTNLRIEFKVDAPHYTKVKKQLIIWKSNSAQPCYQTELTDYDNNFFDVAMDLEPRTEYSVRIILQNSEQQISADSHFETGKMSEKYTAEWIGNSNKSVQNTLFKKSFETTQPIVKARLYATGLGLYEAYLDHQKIGDEYLAPGVTAYDKWIQVQTYDVTEALQSPATHELRFSTGDGWYKGIYGFDGGKDCIYGDQQRILAELHLTYADGSTTVLNTDSSWETTTGKITKSAIYYGEDIDDTLTIADWQPVVILSEPKTTLQDRLSLPIKIHENLEVQQILTTPAKETVLDFGQNHAGWLTFYNREPKGTVLTFQFGEILQQENFYRENLRTARASFTYVSDGKEGWVRPHFTYFGFRYVKVTGNTKPLDSQDYKSPVLYSDMAITGSIHTDNEDVNRLFKNIVWGQKSNFLDVPTDCPQRDERLGWTGDANIFSNTAAYNMNVFQFFKKYARDMAVEQSQHDGMLTMYAPAMGVDDGGAAVWGDAATIIPWNMYQDYGDTAVLKQNYTAMKSWVNWITANTKTPNLWTGMFQFGDWIALDGENPALPTGKTDEDFIASVYYYYSSLIVAKTAAMLNHSQDADEFSSLAANIKSAIQSEYITPTGRLAIDTQTAYALALQFELVPKSQVKRVLNDLTNRLGKDNDHLKTGFVGTPFICQVLSKYGQHKIATKIFLQTDFPSWLYAVKMGATTVWERWNSVEPDGSMNKDGMNSLNHYSIGAIMEWAYKYLVGISEHDAGYQSITFAPHFDYRLKQISGHYDTPYGSFKMSSRIETDASHTIKVSLTVPFGATVTVKLPRAEGRQIHVNDQILTGNSFKLTGGQYEIYYQPTNDYIEHYSEDTAAATIMADKQLVQQIDRIDPVLDFFRNDPDAAQGGLGKMSLTKLNTLLPFINIAPDHLVKINDLLTSTPLSSERQFMKER